MRSFVGLDNYSRKFVQHFLALAAQNALCSPRARCAWGDAKYRSFYILKAAFTSAPVLCVPDPARQTRLLRVNDASELADTRGNLDPRAARRRWRVPPSNIRIAKLTQSER